MTNIFDPEYWRSMGIEPVVIQVDPEDDDSVNQCFEQIDQTIREVSSEINAETRTQQDSSD